MTYNFTHTTNLTKEKSYALNTFVLTRHPYPDHYFNRIIRALAHQPRCLDTITIKLVAQNMADDLLFNETDKIGMDAVKSS